MLPFMVETVLGLDNNELDDVYNRLKDVPLYGMELARNPPNVKNDPANPVYCAGVFDTAWKCLITLNPLSKTLDVEGTLEAPRDVKI